MYLHTLLVRDPRWRKWLIACQLTIIKCYMQLKNSIPQKIYMTHAKLDTFAKVHPFVP